MRIVVAALFLILSANNMFSQVIEGIKKVEQLFDQWCWVASSWVIIDYYGGDINGNQLQQCDIAEYTRKHSKFHDFGQVPCCETTNPSWKCNYWNYNYDPDSGSIKMVLIDTAGIKNYGVARKLTIEECQRECKAGRPFIIRMDSPGHFVVGYGIENGNLYFSDPWPGQGLCVEPYGDSLHRNRKWTHTNILTTDPPSKCVIPETVSIKNITDISANVKWNVTETASVFDLQYRCITDSQWTVLKKLTVNEFVITNLTPAHGYEVQLRRVCSGNKTSEWSESLFFSTSPDITGPVPVNNIQTSSFTLTIPGQGKLSFPDPGLYDAKKMIEIFSVNGNLMETLTFYGKNYTLNSKNLSNGLYIFQIRGRKNKTSRPFMITAF